MSDKMILAFDTSGPYCGTAIFAGGDVIAARHEEMVKGQAEALMPLVEATMQDANLPLSQLTQIAVGTGPGNFTGIRIAVSAARGLSLSLGIPATGVTLFEALAVKAPLPILATLQATRHELYVSEIHDDWHSEPQQMAIEHIPPPSADGCTCIGHRSQEVAAHLGLQAQPAAYAPASAIARHVASLEHIPNQRPTPYYLRPADAAPPRDPAPVILS